MFSKPSAALVIIGHGSTVNPDSSAPAHAHAAEIMRRGIFAEVACGFWK
jgi:sirohydrochlorin cobaltochelatase